MMETYPYKFYVELIGKDPKQAFNLIVQQAGFDLDTSNQILLIFENDYTEASKYTLEKYREKIIWFDVLSDEAVSFAAYVWKISKSEAWGKLDRAIKAEEISQRLPFTELQEYVQHIAGIPTSPPLPPIAGDLPAMGGMPKAGGSDLHPIRKDNPSEKVFNAILTVGALILLSVLAYVFISVSLSYGNSSYDVPEPAPPHSDYDPALRYNYTDEPLDEPIDPDATDTDSAASCNIKGNISFDTGEKIYHLPTQEFYASTTIDTSAGERWFCTEAEARAAGWRKSNR